MAFTFKLEHPDGTPADPPMLRSAVPNWEIGDKIPFGPWSRRSDQRMKLRGARGYPERRRRM